MVICTIKLENWVQFFKKFSMSKTTIEFSNSTVRAGERITGKVHLSLRNTVEFTSIILYLIGEESIEYKVDAQRAKVSTSNIRKQQERFQQKGIITLPEGIERPTATSTGFLLHSGEYSFPFSVLLPPNLLQSISIANPTVEVKYYAIAKLNAKNSAN